jgi:hypothetical protein
MVIILQFWTLSIALFSIRKHDVSETGFCLRLQVVPTRLGSDNVVVVVVVVIVAVVVVVVRGGGGGGGGGGGVWR